MSTDSVQKIPDGAIEYFNLIKDYAKHEDGLINNRMGWVIAINTVLLPTIAAVLLNRAWFSNLDNINIFYIEVRLFSFVIFGCAAIGLMTTLFCGFGVWAAMTALSSLSAYWHKFRCDNAEALNNVQIPGILGGGYDERKS